MRGAPHAGFSAIIRKIRSHSSSARLSPSCLSPPPGKPRPVALEPSAMPSHNVSGSTITSVCIHPGQGRRRRTQNSRSGALNLGSGCRVLRTANCCRRAPESDARARVYEAIASGSSDSVPNSAVGCSELPSARPPEPTQVRVQLRETTRITIRMANASAAYAIHPSR